MISRDQGWFTASYAQVCHWLWIDHYQVEDAQALVAEHGLSGDSALDCPTLFLPLREEDERFSQVRARVLPDQRSEATLCRTTPTLDSERPYVRSGDPTQLVVLEGLAGEPELGGSDWVVVAHDEQFLTRHLGCGFGVIFCTRPMGEPAMPRD